MWSPVTGFTVVCSSLAHIYKARAEANTLAYFNTATINAVKSYIIQTRGVNVTKIFIFFTDVTNKLKGVYFTSIFSLD